jgi:hypothetical protein
VRRLRRLPSIALALASFAALAPAPAGADVHLSATPALYPVFQRDVTDYVSRCTSGKPLTLSGQASGGEKVAIGSHKAQSGDFSQDVQRRTGEAVTVHVTSPTQPGTYHVRCLPPKFPRWSTSRAGTPQAQWYVLTPVGKASRGYVAIFDTNGVPVWWRHSSSYAPWDAKPMPDGGIAWTHYLGDPFGQPGALGYEEQSFDGTRTATVRAVGTPTDTHDLQQLPNGHYLVISYHPRPGVDLRAHGGPKDATVYDGEIQELTRKGKVAWSWKSNNHIDLAQTPTRWWQAMDHDQSRKKAATKRYWDLVHLNSVQPDSSGLIVSARHLDAVFHIDRATKEIDWKIGGTPTPQSLTVVGDPLGDQPFGGQHDARLYGDGTLTVFDNETLRGRPPRAVRYSIDTATRTATFVESIGTPAVGESVFGGSARKLPGRDWVVYWGGSTVVTEQTESGTPVFELNFRDDRWGYRTVPILPGQLSAQTLRHGMDHIAKAHRHRSGR